MRNEKNLSKSIISFVNTWDEVIDIKTEEYNSKEEKRARLQEKNQRRADAEPDSAFAYIYSWLEVTTHGNIAPHRGRPYDGNKQGRLRHNAYPIAADICDYLCEHKPGNYTDPVSIINSVNRVLPRLVQDKYLNLAADRTYRPQTIEYYRKTELPKFVQYCPIAEKQFFSVSKSTYIIYFQSSELHNEIEYLKNYVGEKHCFDIFSVDTKVIILIKGKLEEARKTGTAIHDLIEKTYAQQEKMRNENLEALNNQLLPKIKLTKKDG